MSNLVIRNVLISDLDRVAEIEATCFPASEAAPKKSIKERLEVYPAGFFVAEKENKIIGFINGASTDATTIEDAFFETMDLHDDLGKNLVIYSIAVLPTEQKQGCAKVLMNTLIDFAKKENKSTVVLTCKDTLIPYYSKFGYSDHGVSDSVHGGAKWYDMVLKL